MPPAVTVAATPRRGDEVNTVRWRYAWASATMCKHTHRVKRTPGTANGIVQFQAGPFGTAHTLNAIQPAGGQVTSQFKNDFRALA
jgi:hypothetical protein